MRLNNKTAVITGAASGIGLAIATRFAEEGANVVAGDWDGEKLDVAVESIRANGGNIVSAQGDISKQETGESLIDLAITTYGGLEVLCNNAGVMDYMQGVGEIDNDIWQKVMSVNLEAAVFTSRKAVQYMLEHGGGSIVNIASIAGLHGGIAGAAYTCSKHALIGLTQNTAWMYAKRGIRCNAICPGATATNMPNTLPGDRVDPAGRQRAQELMAVFPSMLEPSDIASVALFLASDESKNINGAKITADGGWDAG